MWLAIMADVGSFPEGLSIFSPTYGRLSVDIFNVSTGQSVAALSGSFLRDDPEEGFAEATWISDRDFLLPLNNQAGAWLCDLSTANPSGDPVFDVVPSRPEILGREWTVPA
jgi:hypothetical protein